MKFNAKKITKIAVIAALYAVITIGLAPISYGNIQVRISEALTLLPFFLGIPAAIGLWIGCIFANYFGGFGVIDIVLGAGLTLFAGLFTARAKNLYIGAIYPVVFNAFGVAFILYYTLKLPYWLTVLQVGIGEFVSVFIVGIMLMKILKKYDFFKGVNNDRD